MSIISPLDRPLHRGDHVTCHDQPYVVLNVDLTAPRVHLAPGDDPDHVSAFGHVFAPLSALVWRA